MAWSKYGTEHRKRAERIRATAVGKTCRLCGDVIRPGQPVDAGHPGDAPLAIDPNSKADAPEHALKKDCAAGGNRAAGARLGNTLEKFKPSRSW